MVKCLNDGPDGRLIDKFLIRDLGGNAPARKCPKFGKPDCPEYRKREFVDEDTREVYIRLVCPVCTTRPLGNGPEGLMTEREYDEFEKKVSKYLTWKAGSKERRVKEELELKKNEIVGKIDPYVSIESPDYKKILAKELENRKTARDFGKAEFEIRKKHYGSEEAKKWLEEHKEIKGIPLPRKYGKYISDIKPSLYWFFGGLISSALLQSPGFFFAGLFFGGSALIPEAEGTHQIQEKVKELKRDFDAEMAGLKDPKARRERIERFKADIEMEKLMEGMSHNLVTSGVARWGWTKEFLKAAGFVILFITLLLGSRVIPFSGIIGLIIGFVGYFSFNTERKPD